MKSAMWIVIIMLCITLWAIVPALVACILIYGFGMDTIVSIAIGFLVGVVLFILAPNRR